MNSKKTFTTSWVAGIVLLSSWILQFDCAFAQKTREHFVSDASYIVGTYQPKQPTYKAADMAAAARAFVDSLDESQQRKAIFPINSPERREWTNLPPASTAAGLRLGDCNEEQIRALCDLMAAILSESGYKKLCHVMLADDQLLSNGRPRAGIGTETFQVLIFGDPAADSRWAFQLDGHHLGINVTISGERVTLSPSFIGTQPEKFQIADTEYRPLTGEIDEAYALVNTLSDDLRRQAVLSPRRGPLRTGPGSDGLIPQARGVPCKLFSDEQKKAVLSLLSYWVNDLPPHIAKEHKARLEKEVDEMVFSWNGALTPRSDISYAIQGPSIIVEFACQGAPDNPLDHIHTMYRDPTNEYGKGWPSSPAEGESD
jgi:hypothetical protein